MSRRLLIIACAFAVFVSSVDTAHAGSHVVYQKTSRLALGHIYLSRGLVPGHAYRLDLRSAGHKSFSGYGNEFFNGIANRQLFTGNQYLTLQGKTPSSISVKQPGRSGVRLWVLTLSVSLLTGSGLTLQLVDLGRSK